MDGIDYNCYLSPSAPVMLSCKAAWHEKMSLVDSHCDTIQTSYRLLASTFVFVAEELQLLVRVAAWCNVHRLILMFQIFQRRYYYQSVFPLPLVVWS